ncbi:MAG: secondary thiamine-phosphate synthase enzyme YjbQ [Myxococcales bacterium]|nr:secondary thiamine-phosphate synthase enzyme YjbQ [Myxococcales bacterium]
MAVTQQRFSIRTPGRGTIEITEQVQQIVAHSEIEVGLCNVFLHHTGASLIMCENADPSVRHDLETFFSRIAPDGDPAFIHVLEGPDDMSAHVRMVLTKTELTMPITEGECTLGRWQGIYLYEHRITPHTRDVTVTVFG